MLSLNVISDELKKEIKLNNLYLITKHFLAILIILLSLYSTAFLVGKLLLIWHFTETIDTTNFLLKKNEDKAAKIRDINNLISAVDKIQSDYIQWTNFLGQIADLTSDVSVRNLKIDKKTSTIYIAGRAATRDNLLSLKDKIEKSENFSDFDLPLKSLLEKTNINFEIRAKIKKYDFN